MNDILKRIVERINDAQGKKGFLDVVFGRYKQEALNGKPVVLFGAGGLGKELFWTLKLKGVSPSCFCDNDDSRAGSLCCGIPVISFAELKKSHRDSLIVIASVTYLEPITRQLLDNGFPESRVLCKESDLGPDLMFMHMYANNGTVSCIAPLQRSDETLLEVLRKNEQKISDGYNVLSDMKSKDLFIGKLALMASNEHFELFKEFMLSFSEPILQFGLGNHYREGEVYFYFNNDVLSPSQDDVYVDVGASDGDTVQTFVNACVERNVQYKHIYAFEPDPRSYQLLLGNTAAYGNISYHRTGVWSKTTIMRYQEAIPVEGYNKEGGVINDTRGVEIDVVSLDDFLDGKEATFIKMDPGGNIIPDCVKGAARTIAQYRPKLALGVYHSLEAVFEIPLLVKSICPEYRMFLRHNACHTNETDLYATL